jgi:hypothetical protein
MKAFAVPSSVGVCPAGVGTSVSFAGEVGDGVAVAFEGGAFVVCEVELFEYLVDAVFDGEEFAAVGILR